MIQNEYQQPNTDPIESYLNLHGLDRDQMKTVSPRQDKTVESDVLQTRLELIHQPQSLHTVVNHSKAIESHHSSLITKPKVKHLHGLNKDQHTHFPCRVQSSSPFPSTLDLP
jgi:hypothetical protein